MENKKQNRKATFSLSWLSLIMLLLLIAYSFILIAILLWAATSSVKTVYYFNNIDVVWPQSLLPWEWEFNNFLFVFANFKVRLRGTTQSAWLENMALNSLLYAGVGALLHTGVACLMAYLSAKFKYKFSSLIYWIVVICMTIPIVGADISNIQILNTLNLFDTFTNDYAEAAFLDGAGETKVLIQVILPLVSSTFFTVFLLNFITFWNDYLVPLLYLPTHPTLSYGVQYLTDGGGEGDFNFVPIRMATCFLVAIPILTLFLFFRGRIMNKVSMGGIKE